ncbi:hypothetical protein CSUB01_05960 [Colletotrichum sublineola]|uniref:Transferase n=1 Tax=Colletotrichum sublineola TaxID=1173701 RepID=A0A066WV64_COLSU|nr:hypothetical protein CSUB01_05960 [Colletotrichum sublineola]
MESKDYPIGSFDNTVVYKKFLMSVFLAFSEPLDPKEYYDTLVKVVRRPGWDKLTARIRRNDKGELVYRISQSFSKDHPSITYEAVDFRDTLIADHPDGARIPRPPSDGGPAVVGNPDDLHGLVYGPKTPKRLRDYLDSDQSLLGLRFVSFKDATVIVLHWMHLAFDAMALKSLLDAWSLSLKGKHDEIAKPIPLHTYPLGDLGKNPKEAHVLADRQMSMFGIAWWALRNFFRLAIRKKEHRMVCVPAKVLAMLKQDALRYLETQNNGTEFLSDGDILVAWLTRLSLSDSKRSVTIQQAYDWRPVLEDRLPPGNPFLSNCVGFLVTHLPASDLLTKPLGYLAGKIRGSITGQHPLEQVEAYCSLVRQYPKWKLPPFFGCSSMDLRMFSNWSKAKFYNLDLSDAQCKPLQPYYVQTVQGPYEFTDGIIIVGKDVDGNYWLSGHKVEGEWDAIEEKMNKEWDAMKKRMKKDS